MGPLSRLVPQLRSGALLWGLAAACLGDESSPRPRVGTVGRGEVLLPSGWSIAPVGRHLPVGDLPLDMAESPDGRFLVVTNDGYSKPWLDVIDLERWQALDRFHVENAWLGLAFEPGGRRLFSSAAGAHAVDEFAFASGALRRIGSIALPSPVKDSFVGGLGVSPDGARLYALNVLADTLSVVDLATLAVLKTVALPAEPYAVVVSPDGRWRVVALWGGARVLVMDAVTL